MSEHEVLIERLAFGGEGVGRIHGKVVFVPWTAPGDRAKIRITENGDRFDRGELLEILEPSPDRTTPRCSVFGKCGGCQWQHLKYEAQLLQKESILRETLKRIGKITSPPLLPILPAPDPWQYRNRIQLHRGQAGEIGFFAARSRSIVSFDQCEIADPALNEKVRELRKSPNGQQDSFELVSNGEKVLKRGIDPSERIFSQANPQMNPLLLETVLTFSFSPAEPAFARRWAVVDLFSGSGNFSFPLAERAGRVIAVEESRPSVQEAENNARRKGIQNIEFICGSAEWGLKTVYRKKLPVDLLVLDPPRGGAKEILDLIGLIRPRFLVYVSCDPSTLARDLEFLLRRHFDLDRIQPLDMFPQTYHIESVARLVRREGG